MKQKESAAWENSYVYLYEEYNDILSWGERLVMAFENEEDAKEYLKGRVMSFLKLDKFIQPDDFTEDDFFSDSYVSFETAKGTAFYEVTKMAVQPHGTDEPDQEKAAEEISQDGEEPWYTENWYDEDLRNALTEAGIPVTDKAVKALRDKVVKEQIFQDLSSRNEMLAEAAESLDFQTGQELSSSDEIETEAVEMCPYCCYENSYPNYNVDENGYVVLCRNCGEQIMLCDECMHADDNTEGKCDWHEDGDNGFVYGRCFRGTTKHNQ